jgi:hypothetical protein
MEEVLVIEKPARQAGIDFSRIAVWAGVNS